MAVKPLLNVGSAPNDGTGDPLRTAGQKLNNLVSRSYVASATQFGGATNDQIVQATITAAIADGVTLVQVPAALLPYTAGLVTFNGTVRMTREGGNPAVYDVKAYGAAGDGATNDSPAIQAAIDGCAASGGGTIYFPAGTYLAARTGSYDYGGLGLQIKDYALGLPTAAGNTTPNIQFLGAGRSASILKKTTLGGITADYNLVLAKAVSGAQCAWLSFTDLGFDGGQTGASTPFTSGDEHLLMMPIATHLSIERCKFVNARGGGLYLWQGYFGKIGGSHFESLDLAGANNAITLIGGTTFITGTLLGMHTVERCTFRNNGQIGIGVGGFAGSGEQDAVVIANCGFVTDTGVAPQGLGIELVNAGGADLLKRATITGCVFEGGSGMTLQGSDTQVANCTFRNMNRGGGLGIAIQFNNAPGTFRCSIVNCSVDTCANSGFDVTGTRTQISGCSITGCATGINIQAAGAGTQLTGNNLVGNTAGIADAGSGTVRTDNQLTAGALQGRVVLSGGAATVNTAEIQTNDNVLLTEVVTGGTAGAVRVSAIVAGTSFTITSTSGTDTGTVFWKIVH